MPVCYILEIMFKLSLNTEEILRGKEWGKHMPGCENTLTKTKRLENKLLKDDQWSEQKVSERMWLGKKPKM